jgi:AcrR family transcriptional regulator
MARPRIGDERREEILAAFEGCVVHKGFAKTTLIDVAEAAGQPRALVRYFIGNRADMVSALIDRLLERGETQFRQLPKDGSAEQALDIVLDRIFADETTNIVIMELWHLSLRDAALRARLAAIYDRVIFEIAALIDGPDPRDRAFSAVAMAFGAAFFRHLGLGPSRAGHVRAASHRLLDVDDSIQTGA